MLQIKQLAFSYDDSNHATSTPMRFTVDVEPGEVLSLIGPSGAGKSTLLNLVAGFLPADSGSIEFNQQEIQNLAPAKRPVTMVFQEHNLFPHLDVFTNIALGINPTLKLSTDDQDAISDALNNLGLAGFDQRKPGQLSGGQRQRVAIARALVRKHAILLLDEPFAALGPAQRTEMIELVKALVVREQMMALLVSHQPSDALLASQRTAFIDQGRVIKVEPTRQLLNDSDEIVVKGYLGL